MTRVSGLLRWAVLPGLLLAGCVDDKGDLPKGAVDDSSPPGSPFDLEEGKADNGATRYTVALESAHPYANNLHRDYALSLDTVVPACAVQARVHFAALRTEAGYDTLTVRDSSGNVISTFDGRHDGIWSDWVPLTTTGKKIVLHLDSDYSVTDYGFRIDAIEEQEHVTCPMGPITICQNGYYDVTPPTPTCGCRGQTQCTEDGWVQIDHTVGGGFTGQFTGHRVVGTTAQSIVIPLNTPETDTTVGAVDHAAVQQLVHDIIADGILDRTPPVASSNWNESFTIRIGTKAVAINRAAGSYPANEQALIAEFEDLFTCGGSGTPLTCGDGYSCSTDGQCNATIGCVCPTLYDPQCGVNGHTYSNGCSLGCSGVAQAHAGACGITGDTCGTMVGLTCQDGYKCRFGTSQYDYPYPDAAGACVAQTYCDAAADCAGLPHVAVPGAWGCDANACAWHAGPTWQALSGFAFATAHPYTNNQTVWSAPLTLPAGAAKMRLVSSGTFALENGYDFLEVWAWRNNAWTKVKSYTGTTAPALSDEFTGQYFYLKFVSDVSVTANGFNVTVQYANQ